MSVGRLRPVGEFLPLRAIGRGTFDWPAGYRVAWTDSGTTALGLALRAAVERTGHPSPSVILPGYTCPDVVSAALWAGLRPVVADTLPGSPWLDVDSVRTCLDDGVVAVIAPHFLGLRHPLREVAEMCRTAGVVLVEDSAQLGPASPAFRPEADLVVLSFGRGKPVPAGGGALLHRDAWHEEVEPLWRALPEAGYSRARWQARALVQNAAMTRPGYALARRLPGLHVGETSFRPLRNPRRLAPAAGRIVEGVLSSWRPATSKIQLQMRELLIDAGVPDLPGSLGWDRQAPLLRYPVLMRDAARRDAAWRRLEAEGLGASALYERALPQIQGMPALAGPAGIECARDFAARLLTLPAHSDVSALDVAGIGARLASRPTDERGAPRVA